MKKLKLLVISYSYTPDLTPRAFRWSKIAMLLAGRGHEIHVLCSGLTQLEDENYANSGVSVYRVRDWLLNASSRVSPDSLSSNSNISSNLNNKKITILVVLRKLVRAVWRAVFWPDYSCGWIVPALIAARKLCLKNKYDWIISVSHPFSGHVVGLVCVSTFSKSRWFVDISDPYSDMSDPSPNNFLLYSRLNKFVESRVIKLAEIVSVTTEQTKKLYESSFSINTSKVHVIPPLLSLPEIDHIVYKRDERVIRFIYVGTLYKSLRSPIFVLKCINALCQSLSDMNIELHFYGALNDCREDFDFIDYAKNFKVITHGLVSRDHVTRSMAEADILINIGNNSETQLASKVIEYMVMAKPILNFISIEHDSSLSVLQNYSSILTIFRNDENFSAEIIESIKKFVLMPPSVDSTIVNSVRSQYSAVNVSKMYASFLEQS